MSDIYHVEQKENCVRTAVKNKGRSNGIAGSALGLKNNMCFVPAAVSHFVKAPGVARIARHPSRIRVGSGQSCLKS